MRHYAPVVAMVLIAKVIALGLVAQSLMRSTDAILLCVPVQTLAPTIRRLVDAPLIDGWLRPGDIDGIQLETMGPCNVCCIATPAVVPRDNIAKTPKREQCQCKQRKHDAKHF